MGSIADFFWPIVVSYASDVSDASDATTGLSFPIARWRPTDQIDPLASDVLDASDASDANGSIFFPL